MGVRALHDIPGIVGNWIAKLVDEGQVVWSESEASPAIAKPPGSRAREGPTLCGETNDGDIIRAHNAALGTGVRAIKIGGLDVDIFRILNPKRRQGVVLCWHELKIRVKLVFSKFRHAMGGGDNHALLDERGGTNIIARANLEIELPRRAVRVGSG